MKTFEKTQAFLLSSTSPSSPNGVVPPLPQSLPPLPFQSQSLERQNRRDTSRYVSEQLDISDPNQPPPPRGALHKWFPTNYSRFAIAGSPCTNSSRLKSEEEEEEEGGVCPRGIRGGAPPFLGFLSFYEAKLIYAAGFTTPSTSAGLPNGLGGSCFPQCLCHVKLSCIGAPSCESNNTFDWPVFLKEERIIDVSRLLLFLRPSRNPPSASSSFLALSFHSSLFLDYF